MLPDAWVNWIFAKLSATYGQSFLRQYDGVPLNDVKANWAEELGRYLDKREAIAHALGNLPSDRAPTVLQFRDLCRQATPSAPERALLSAPGKSSPIAPEVAKEVRKAFAGAGGNDPKAWARILKKKEESGIKLSQFQRHCWREALKYEMDQ